MLNRDDEKFVNTNGSIKEPAISEKDKHKFVDHFHQLP